ncbi:hypothetical protein FS749_003895 [Ceratobasidium sp. UAMH 11750]|nr:hypothetical protein FS749_003895 [Ceratobasidium sp. UAMH 11750]
MLTKCDFYPFQLASCTFHVLRLVTTARNTSFPVIWGYGDSVMQAFWRCSDPATLNSHPSCLHSGVLVWDFLLGALSPPDGAAISFLGRYGTEELELRTRPFTLITLSLPTTWGIQNFERVADTSGWGPREYITCLTSSHLSGLVQVNLRFSTTKTPAL